MMSKTEEPSLSIQWSEFRLEYGFDVQFNDQVDVWSKAALHNVPEIWFEYFQSNVVFYPEDKFQTQSDCHSKISYLMGTGLKRSSAVSV